MLTPGAQVSWNGSSATVYKEGVLSLTAVPGQDYIIANGRYLPTEGIVAKNGSVLIPLNTIVKATDASCVWISGKLALTTGSGGILSADQFYNADDLYWLSRIIYAESGNQPLSGKIAVGNVVLNRVASDRFPDTVKSVVFDRKDAVQFEPVANGTVYHEPTLESVLAAKLVLDGARAAGDSLYFIAPELTTNHWTMENQDFVVTIGCHWFYR